MLLVVTPDYSEALRICRDNDVHPLSGRVRVVARANALIGWPRSTPVLTGRFSEWLDGRGKELASAVLSRLSDGRLRHAQASDLVVARAGYPVRVAAE